MIREIQTLTKPINARIRVPGSKSLTNRALVCAALAGGESLILNASDSDDTSLMRNGLNQLGVLVRKKDETLIVDGTRGKLYAPKFPIPVGNAGTTLRFLLSLSSLAVGKTVLEGSQRMAERPVEELRRSLGSLGTKVECLPRQSRFIVHGGSFQGGTTTVQVSQSSQFLSSLLMVAPYAQSDVMIEVDGEISSASYIDLTLHVMKEFGVSVEKPVPHAFAVRAHQQYVPTDFLIEPDASSATYFLAAAAIYGGEVRVEGITYNSLQGDAAFADILKKMGCEVEDEGNAIRLKSEGVLRGISVDMNSMPDAVPTLAVTALFAQNPTRITNIAQLRHKESDRLQALESALSKLGANIRASEHSLEINPAPLKGVQLETFDDHRLAMAFALVGLKVSGVRVENPACVKKSFPGFWSQFEKLY